jgi:hypothetical protein
LITAEIPSQPETAMGVIGFILTSTCWLVISASLPRNGWTLSEIQEALLCTNTRALELELAEAFQAGNCTHGTKEDYGTSIFSPRLSGFLPGTLYSTTGCLAPFTSFSILTAEGQIFSNC